MIRLTVTLERTDGWSFEEFREYYFEEHVPIAKEIPNLEKYTVSLALDPDEAAYDAIADLYFETPEALQEAMGSEEAQAALEDVPNFADPDAGFDMATEEHVQLDRT